MTDLVKFIKEMLGHGENAHDPQKFKTFYADWMAVEVARLLGTMLGHSWQQDCKDVPK